MSNWRKSKGPRRIAKGFFPRPPITFLEKIWGEVPRATFVLENTHLEAQTHASWSKARLRVSTDGSRNRGRMLSDKHFAGGFDFSPGSRPKVLRPRCWHFQERNQNASLKVLAESGADPKCLPPSNGKISGLMGFVLTGLMFSPGR